MKKAMTIREVFAQQPFTPKFCQDMPATHRIEQGLRRQPVGRQPVLQGLCAQWLEVGRVCGIVNTRP